MATILLVEDDPDQRELRTMTLEASGHTVRAAASAAEALEMAEGAEVALVDMRIPAAEDGAALIGRLREQYPAMRIAAVSGLAADLKRLPQRVEASFEKPVRTRELLRWIARVAVLALAAGLRAESVVHLDLSAPGTDWERASQTSVLAAAGGQHVMVYAGAARHRYSVFTSDPRGLRIRTPGVRTHRRQVEPAAPHVRHAPVLFERRNAIGKFTDIPLLSYCEKLRDQDGDYYQYSVIFSNEDGGTSTRSLMAKWGRTTDIEYVYRVWVNGDGSRKRAIVQGRNHRDLEFTGPFEGDHPLLMPVTDNNMVAGEGPSAVRYQPAPVLVDLSRASRETVMDSNPQTWRAMTSELVREGKLRPYGVEQGEAISDPRNYLYIEANVKAEPAGVFFTVTAANGETYTSHKGRPKDTVNRNGWIRSTIELPPGTRKEDLRSLSASGGTAEIQYLFLLGKDMLPGPRFTLP